MLENIAIANLTSIIEDSVKDESQLRAIKEISLSVLQGTSVADACLLARITKDTYDKWVEAVPEIAEKMNINRLTYKQKLKKTLYEQATLNGDFKVALQLLISEFPNEFNPAIQKENQKHRPDKDSGQDVLQEVFNLIQDSDTSTVEVTQAPKEANIKQLDVQQTIKDILSWST